MCSAGNCVALERACIDSKTGTCSFYKTNEQYKSELGIIANRLFSMSATSYGRVKLAKLLLKYPSLQKIMKENGHAEFIKTFKKMHGISL